MYLRTVLRSKPRLSAIARSGRPAAQCSRTSTTFATRKLLRPMAPSLGQEVTAWFQAAAWSAGDELAEHQVGELPEQISRRLGELIERRHKLRREARFVVDVDQLDLLRRVRSVDPGQRVEGI